VVEEVEVLIRMMVYGMVMVVMEVTQLDQQGKVEVLILMVMINKVDMLEVEEVVVIVLTTHRMLEVEEVVRWLLLIQEDQEVQVVIIGVVLHIITIMVVILLQLVVNYGTLCTGK
jgi:hypothetical protein